ncbi:TetR family transcriptional regulator [Roseomonas sp. OT10]|uniref:TetR/AcrR family transcriptional regulator n=1 Tax=Roseomonas cutis TaxID=2897332 RepID=UPI001E4DFF25|nr:TetR/AcrR family transcriptional regulator [Roseomonas sp. OT10]UFN47561.1 TetR family transcriptional regulator [Roseomonas sp. OT10]
MDDGEGRSLGSTTDAPAATGPVRRRRAPAAARRDPARTRRNLIESAYREFARAGYHGASIERICRAAGVSKQILSHHFGSKENAYLAVLELAYERSRARDAGLEGEGLDPAAAMRDFVGFAFDHLRQNRDFVSLLADENVNKGIHIRRSARLRASYGPLLARIAALLRRGEQAGVFRPGIDPKQLYISISGLCFFLFSNGHTLSAVFGEDLLTEEALSARRAHVMDFVMAALAPRPAAAAP